MTERDPADALSARIQRSTGEDTPFGLLTHCAGHQCGRRRPACRHEAPCGGGLSQ